MSEFASPAFRRIFAGLVIVVALGALDQTIVTTALPAIAREMHGLEELSWIIVAYLLTATSVTLVYGKLSDIYGRRRLMLVAVALFLIASILCALAQNVTQLVLARALQGAGGGGLIVLGQATLADLVSPRERGRYQAWFSLVWATAGVAGPPLGGFFVDALTWRWAFWVNIPLAVAAYVIFSRTTLLDRAPSVARRSIDYFGIALFTVASTLMLLISSLGGSSYAWTSPTIVSMSLAAVVFLAVFVVSQFRTIEPVLPPRIFADSIVRVADAGGFILSMLLYGVIVLTPVYLQLVLGMAASTSGACLVPFMASSTGISFVASQLMRRTGRYKWMLQVGMVIAAFGFVLLATMDADTPAWVVMSDTFIIGIGLGPCFPVLNVALANAAQPRDMGVVVSTMSLSRQLGGSFGAAIFWSFFLTTLAVRLTGASRVALEHAFSATFYLGFAVALTGVFVMSLLREVPLRAAAVANATAEG